MIEVTGVKTSTKYFINPDHIGSLQVIDGSTTIHILQEKVGAYKVFKVLETPKEIINMIQALKVEVSGPSVGES